MSQDRRQLNAKVPAEKAERVEAYCERQEYDHKSDAVRELLGIGLREAEAPLLYRVKNRSLDAAYHLALVSVVTVITGYMTSALAPGNALAIAMVLMSVAAAPVACVEAAKLARAWRHGGGS